MSNAASRLLIVGLVLAGAGSDLSVAKQPRLHGGSASDEKTEPKPDVLVYVDLAVLVPSQVLLGAEATASKMFAKVGLRVEWTTRPPEPAVEATGAPCVPGQPEVIGIRMALTRPASTRREAFADALPYASSGIRITVYYGELSKAIQPRPSLATVLLAHVLAHEIGHVLQGVAQHSSEGVMRAQWGARDYADMRQKPLEFAAADTELIHLGLQRTRSRACAETASAISARK